MQELFPFKDYFADAGELFRGESFEEDMSKAQGCFRHLKTIFQELEECRAFELLKVLAPLVSARALPDLLHHHSIFPCQP